MLTDAQKTTLAAHIRANSDAEVVAALAIRNDTELTRLYNLDSSFIVWRPSIPPTEYRAAMVWNEVDQMTAGAARIWDWVTMGMTEPLDGSDANIRQGIADAFGQNTTTRGNLLAVAKRAASVFEEIFATGTGNNGNPGTLVVEGPLSLNDLSGALNNF